MSNYFGARGTFDTGSGTAIIYRLSRLAEAGIGHIDRLPYSIKILLENALRNQDGRHFKAEDVEHLAGWDANNTRAVEIPFGPAPRDSARLYRCSIAGRPGCAAQRHGSHGWRPAENQSDGACRLGHRPFGTSGCLRQQRCLPAQCGDGVCSQSRKIRIPALGSKRAFANLKVVPPATGIVHQVNLEYLAKVVQLYDDPQGDGKVALPDSLVGTDSHTTMINGLGVLGWGVGGIEAEAAMLGQPVYMLMPQVYRFQAAWSIARRFNGDRPRAGSNADAARKGRSRQVCRVLWAGP